MKSLEQTSPQTCQEPMLAVQTKKGRNSVSSPIESNVQLEEALNEMRINIHGLEVLNNSNQETIEDIKKKIESQFQHFNRVTEEIKHENKKVILGIDCQIRDVKEKCNYFVEEMSEIGAWLAEKHCDEPLEELGNKEKYNKMKKN